MPRESKRQTTDRRPIKTPSVRTDGDLTAPPNSFRVASFVVSTLLLVALAAVIILAVRDNPLGEIPPVAVASPTSDEATPEGSAATAPAQPSESPAETPSPAAEQPTETTPTETATPDGAGDTVQLGQERRVEEAGFSFRPPAEYALEFAGASVTLSAAERSPASGAVMLLRADLAAELLPEPADSLGEAFASFVAAYTAERDLVADEAEAVRVGGEAALGADLSDGGDGGGFAGRVVMTEPAQDRLFIMVGLAPVEAWQARGDVDFDAVLDSVAFFAPSATPTAASPTITVEMAPTAETTPTPEAEPTEEAEPTPVLLSPIGPDSNWRVYSNGNFVNRLALLRSTVWAATDGGATAWNKSAGSHVKFTTLDGLSTNRLTSTEYCPLPGLGILFGSDLGLQVFDTEGGSWKTLSSANSPMSFDDIVALHCDVEAQMLIVAYARHGLDIFDVAAGEWTHVDENDGLETGIIRDIAVTAPQTIWLASQLGLTRFSDGESTLYNVENSPMTSNVVTAIAGDGADIVWLATAGDLYRIDGESWETYSRATVADSEFPNGSITGLALAADGSVWIGTDQVQLCRLDADAGRCAEFFSNEEGMALAPLTSLRLDEDGNVYYTTAGAGISMYDGERWQTFVIEDEPVAGNRIRDLARGLDDTVWIATGSGISQVRAADGTPITLLTAANTPLLSPDARVIQPDAAGGLWLGAGGAAFYKEPNWTNYTAAEGLAGTDMQAITIDGESRTWLGSKTGLSIWTGTGFFNLTTDSGLPSDDIRALLADDDVVWIGTGGGLLRFQDNQLQVFNAANINLPSDVITALALDTDGTLLVGTERGLARFRDDRIIAIPDIAAAPVVDIAVGADNTAWVATGAGELYHFDGASWMSIPDLSLLPSPAISALLLDSAGDLWIGAAHGGAAVVSP